MPPNLVISAAAIAALIVMILYVFDTWFALLAGIPTTAALISLATR